VVGFYHCVRTRAGNNLTRLVVACSVTGGELTTSAEHPVVDFFPVERIRDLRKDDQLQNTGLWRAIRDYQRGQAFSLGVLSEVKKHKK
jgi:hypothetical protein